MNIYKTLWIGALFSVLGLVCASASESVMNLRVVWSESPQTEAVVVWDGTAVTGTAELLYDTVSHKDGDRSYARHASMSEAGLYIEGQLNKKQKASPPPVTAPLFYHHVPLKNLNAGTVYYLAVKTADGIGREYHFKTAPNDDRTFKMIYGGDSRSDITIARAINQQISGLISADDSIIALLHGGDYAVTTRRDVWKKWLEAYALTTTESGKLLPIIPIIGNHDVPGKSPIFRQAYGYPGGTADYYLQQLTPSVGIVALNTEISAEGNQRAFLQKSLIKLQQEKVKWQIAAFHRPAFPAVKQPSVAKVSWVPLFEEYNIDLVLESDGHCIKRTVPIRAGKEAADGVVYLGEGGYGAPQRDPKLDRWYLQGEHAFASKGDHVMILEITPAEIHYSTLLKTGEIVDEATFKPHR